ncbi:MAG: DNA-directed RNA polymerase subunit omega [Saprospiraceae bacterium]|nr:DNA-directed RNA polymerase subunit omega [Saprospiraceae bacterium]
MSDIKTQVQGLDPNVKARDVHSMSSETGNIYETLVVVAKRARQLSVDLKHELHNKLEEFAVSTDTIEEINENKEQIEISKFYERLPNPVIIATEEYIDGKLYYRNDRNRRKRY